MVDTLRQREPGPVYVFESDDKPLDLVNAGWSHYSADAVLHRIRWHYHVDRGDRSFKANNNWTPTLARWFMAEYPSNRGFFRTRHLRSQSSLAHQVDFHPEDHEDLVF